MKSFASFLVAVSLLAACKMDHSIDPESATVGIDADGNLVFEGRVDVNFNWPDGGGCKIFSKWRVEHNMKSLPFCPETSSPDIVCGASMYPGCAEFHGWMAENSTSMFWCIWTKTDYCLPTEY